MNAGQFKQLAWTLVAPHIDARTQTSRINFMEENVMLPVKFFIIAFLYYILYASGAFPGEMDVGNLSINMLRRVFLGYLGVSIVGALFLVNMHRLPPVFVQWVVCLINLLDAVFLASLTVLTGVMKEVTYWAFLFLIVRNAMSVPVAWLQIPLNLLMILAYVVAGVYDKALVDVSYQRLEDDDPVLAAINARGYNEALTLRIALMLLWCACCYGFQILFDRQQEAEEELREHIVREEQMQTAGRLAAEIAHQIKNPLGIINNAVYSLRKLTPVDRPDAQQQLKIIQDEVDRSDRIVTELMGYAQLAEGKVESLQVAEELEAAIQQVFPPGAKYPMQINRNIAGDLPRLQMQRGHLREIFVNVLQNSREAMQTGGRIDVSARSSDDYTVFVTIADTGPGISPDHLNRIFEAYYTVKEGGTGLGLAIVKHNIEMYGGSVRVESELGKGTRFSLQFHAKTMLRQRK